MFDQHIICREGFDNVTRDGEIIGVRFFGSSALLPWPGAVDGGRYRRDPQRRSYPTAGDPPGAARPGSGRSTSWRASTMTGGTSAKRPPSPYSNQAACRPDGIA